MKVDELLEGLRELPRPQASAFLPARVAAVVPTRSPRRAPLVLRLYWLAVVFAATPLLGTWYGVATIVLAGAIVAFPSLASDVVAVFVTSPRSGSPGSRPRES